VCATYCKMDLLKATAEKNIEQVKKLLETASYEDVNCKDGSGETPLSNACAFGLPLDIVKSLLDLGADPNSENNINKSTPLIHAVYAKAGVEIISALVTSGASVTYRNKAGATPLIIATICQNDYDTIECLLQNGAEASATQNTGNTSLMYASRNNNSVDIPKLLLDYGAEIDAQTSPTAKYPLFSALHFAAGENRADIASLLIERGASMALINGDGLTPLQLASEATKAQMMQASQKRFLSMGPPGPMKPPPANFQQPGEGEKQTESELL
jgi:ankyrin repeat protein